MNEQIYSLLREYRGLSKSLPEKDTGHKTFLDIARYDRNLKEATFSNVLAFYLDTEEGHGLGDLLIQSLLECVNEDRLESEGCPERVCENVIREYSTKDKLRMDIVAIYDGYILGIENKLWSGVHNSLDAYSKALEELERELRKDGEGDAGGEKGTIGEKKRIIKVLLAPDKKEILGGGFQSVTYEELFERVKLRIWEYVGPSMRLSSNYVIYLMDMFYALSKSSNPMKEELKEERQKKLVEFFSKNLEAHWKMQGMYNEMSAGIYYDLKARKDEFENLPAAGKIKERLERERVKLDILVNVYPPQSRIGEREVGVAYSIEKNSRYKGCTMKVYVYRTRPWTSELGEVVEDGFTGKFPMDRIGNWNLQVMEVDGLGIEEIQEEILKDWKVIDKKTKLRKYNAFPLDKFEEANGQALQVFSNILDLMDHKAS